MKTKGKIRSKARSKILLLLSLGLVLSLKRHTLSGQLRLLKSLKKEWRDIDRQYLYRVINDFKYHRLVSYREKIDGTIQVELTEEGKKRALEFNVDNMTINKPAVWDKKWRVVIFDIPEFKRKVRDALRHKLKELNFHEWQKSVFVHPYHCRDEIDFIVEFFECRQYVRYAEFTDPTNEAELKLHFDL